MKALFALGCLAFLLVASWLAIGRFPAALRPVLRASTAALRKGDVRRAVLLAEAAAVTRAPDAQFHAGLMNERLKTPEADVRALSWYRKAAEGGHRDANLSMGQAYLAGKGAAKDPAKAKEAFARAAAAGSAIAEYSMARLILAGQLPAEDAGEGRRRLEAAAAAGFVPASQELERLKAAEESGYGPRP